MKTSQPRRVEEYRLHKNTLKSARFSNFSTIGFERSVWCTMELSSVRLLIGTCYRSPSSPAMKGEKLLQFLDLVEQQSHMTNVMVLGDFNYPDVDFARHYVNASPNSEQQQFFNTTQDLFLFQHVKEATRNRGNSSSCLDLIFTTEENIVENLQYEVPIGSSDHVCLTWELVAEVQELQDSHFRASWSIITQVQVQVVKTSLLEITAVVQNEQQSYKS